MRQLRNFGGRQQLSFYGKNSFDLKHLTLNLLQTKCHLHPRRPYTRLGYRRGRAGNKKDNTYLYIDITTQKKLTYNQSIERRFKKNPSEDTEIPINFKSQKK